MWRCRPAACRFGTSRTPSGPMTVSSCCRGERSPSSGQEGLTRLPGLRQAGSDPAPGTWAGSGPPCVPWRSVIGSLSRNAVGVKCGSPRCRRGDPGARRPVWHGCGDAGARPRAFGRSAPSQRCRGCRGGCPSAAPRASFSRRQGRGGRHPLHAGLRDRRGERALVRDAGAGWPSGEPRSRSRPAVSRACSSPRCATWSPAVRDAWRTRECMSIGAARRERGPWPRWGRASPAHQPSPVLMQVRSASRAWFGAFGGKAVHRTPFRSAVPATVLRSPFGAIGSS